MKAVFNIVLILAAGAAAFFSYSLSGKFQKEQAARIETKSKEAEAATEADATEKNLKNERVALAEATRQRDEVEQAIAALKSAEASLKRDIAGVDANLATQQAEFAELEKAIVEVQNQLKELDGNITIDNLGDEIVKIEESAKTKKARSEELLTLIEGAQKKISTSKAEAERLTTKVVESNVRISRNAMEAVVTAVNQDWGFLVIGAGSNSGFTPQTSLLVKRDGKLIGRVRPTAIEATQTIADIDLDSLAPGVRIQPGDRVILATPSAN
jgi:hypothetical protein